MPAPRTLLPAAPLRALALCAGAGALVALAHFPARPLPDAVARRGLLVVPGSVHWLDAPSLAARRALFLAREAPTAPADLYVATAHTNALDRVLALDSLANLTRSRDADESSLVVAPPFAAFTSRVAGRVVAITTLDARGEPRSEAALDRGARLRLAVTRAQQTGTLAGYAMDRFDLAQSVPGDVALAIDAHDTLHLEGGVAIALDGSHVLAAGDEVREHPRREAQSGSWVTWAVDTVRSLPFVGPVPIAWAEGLAFHAENVVAHGRRAVLGDRTQSEVAEDLADVLAVHGSRTALEGTVADWPPARLTPVLHPSVAHEGEWQPVAQGDDDPFVRTQPGGPPPLYITFVRTDREREDSRAYITVWDPRMLELHVQPGSEEPMGATGETGSGAIPRDEATMGRLVAGFNGAFQALHGEFGVYGEGTVLLPAKPYAATVALLADGNTAFGTWPPNTDRIPDEIVEFRQNLTPMIDGGVWNPWRRNWWGGLVPGINPLTTDQHTARSGLCLTREGYVAYFWGSTLSPNALGDAMLAARCEYSVQLDMNGANTGFELYRVGAPSTQPSLGRALVAGYEAEGTIGGMAGVTYRGRKLVRHMSESMPRYIHRDPRDFFYLLLRPTLPGRPLVAPVAPALPGEGSWHVAGLANVSWPWPLARTRVRPDPARAERWVNLVRLDPRRVALAASDTSEPVLARFVGASLAQGGAGLRITMTQGLEGARWSIGSAGDGVAVNALAPGASALRGACVDRDGFLVLAVADRAQPDLVSRALDLAGCDGARVALAQGTLALGDGTGAAGETVAPGQPPTLALIARDEPTGRRIFREVTPVSASIWQPAQHRQVRYSFNPDRAGTMQVHLAGQRTPVVIPVRGYVPVPTPVSPP